MFHFWQLEIHGQTAPYKRSTIFKTLCTDLIIVYIPEEVESVYTNLKNLYVFIPEMFGKLYTYLKRLDHCVHT